MLSHNMVIDTKIYAIYVLINMIKQNLYDGSVN